MKIAIKIESLMPDRTNYKQYSTRYAPVGVSVLVDVPDEELISTGEGMSEAENKQSVDDKEIFITERGLQILIGKLADIADDVELEHLHSQLPK